MQTVAICVSLTFSRLANAQDIDITPIWTDPVAISGEAEIGSIQADGSYVVNLSSGSDREIQGLYELLQNIKSKAAFIRVARDFGGAASRAKIRITSLTALPKATGTNAPAFLNSWSSIGAIVFETHMKASSRFQLGEGSMTTSTVGTFATTAHVSTLSLTVDYNAANKRMIIRTRDVASLKDGPSAFTGSYHCTGRTNTLSGSESREIGGGFLDNVLSLTAAKETASARTLIRTRIGPFPYNVDTGVIRIYRSAFSDGRSTLRLSLDFNWASDVTGTAYQYAQVLSAACTSGLKWKADVSRREKSGSANWSVTGNCTSTKSTLPVLCSWTAPAAKFTEVMNLYLEIRPNRTGKGSLNMVYSSSLGGCRMYVQADQYVLDETISSQGTIKSGNAISVEF